MLPFLFIAEIVTCLVVVVVAPLTVRANNDNGSDNDGRQKNTQSPPPRPSLAHGRIRRCTYFSATQNGGRLEIFFARQKIELNGPLRNPRELVFGVAAMLFTCLFLEGGLNSVLHTTVRRHTIDHTSQGLTEHLSPQER